MALIHPRSPNTIETSIEDRIRQYEGINSQIGVEIARAESHFNEKAQNPHSTAKGVFQFLDNTMCAGDALNADDNIACYFHYAEKNEYWRWSASMDKWLPRLSEEAQDHVNKYLECSCVTFIAKYYMELPTIKTPAELSGNSYPHIGSVVLLDYNVPHMAILTSFTNEGFYIREANFKRCRVTNRLIEWGNPALRGFYESK